MFKFLKSGSQIFTTFKLKNRKAFEVAAERCRATFLASGTACTSHPTLCSVLCSCGAAISSDPPWMLSQPMASIQAVCTCTPCVALTCGAWRMLFPSHPGPIFGVEARSEHC